MELEVMLCDYAQVSGNKLFISGANIDRVSVATGAQPPYLVSLAVAGLVHVPWHETNTEHRLTMELQDEDGQPAAVPEGFASPVGGEFAFTVGRPGQLAPGDSQNVPFAFNFAGVPLVKRGRYTFAISIDGAAVTGARFTLD